MTAETNTGLAQSAAWGKSLPGQPSYRGLTITMATCAVLAVVVLGILYIFYSNVYSVHTDLAGAALSGRLALTLGETFREYSLYFPPAERVWFSFAALLSDVTGMALDQTVVLMSGTALMFSTGFAYHIRRITVGATPLFWVGSLAVLLVVPILFKNVFGLREHVVVLGLWPYLVLRISDPDGQLIGWKTRLLLGVWLGATLLFKYLYSVVVLLVELADAAIRRAPLALFRVENLVSGGIVALYLFGWLVLDPAQREAFSAVVSAIDANLAGPWVNVQQAAAHGALALFFIALTVLSRLSPRSAAIGLALIIGALIAAWIQSRWYTHHVFPITMAYLAWLWMIAREVRPLWFAALAVAATMPVLSEHRRTAVYQSMVEEADQAMDAADLSVKGKRVGLLTMHPMPFNQHLAMHGGTRWNASMNNSYVASELQHLDLAENAEMEVPAVELDDPGRQMLHDEMLRLLEDMPPDVIILDESTNWPLRHLDVEWRKVFADDARFNAVLDQYEAVYEHKGERLEFTYFERIDAEN